MTKIYTYDAWVEEFQPIKNTLVKHDNIIHFETYGDEWEFVKSQDNNKIWTEVDGDGGTYIIAGCAWVNRIHYYITENPWTDDMVEVPTWVYRDCDCLDENNDYEPNPDCDECEGNGSVNIDCDTVEQIKEIYGEKVNVVG